LCERGRTIGAGSSSIHVELEAGNPWRDICLKKMKIIAGTGGRVAIHGESTFDKLNGFVTGGVPATGASAALGGGVGGPCLRTRRNGTRRTVSIIGSPPRRSLHKWLHNAATS
jgi:hypothetical protein